ncbi:MAG: hypothetical protein ACOCUW_02845 [Gemmatimonadota bacterium]
MRHTLAFLALVGVAGAGAASCHGPPPVPPVPSAGCAPLWADSNAAALVDALATATANRDPVWGDYDLGDAWYVVDAGRSSAGGACLGAWTAGRTVAYAELPVGPALGTPLYGFYVPDGTRGRVPSSEQPAAVRAWLEDMGVERATIVPTVIEGFPMELSTLTRLQMALHEAFHVEVQFRRPPRRWIRRWPSWDRQPDRAGLQACYREPKAVASSLEEERDALVRTVEALLDGSPTTACRAGEVFLARREARYGMLEEVRVARHDSTPGTCREAEAIMELEEGTADYASWTALYRAGLVSRERLMQRYRAIQDDVFYLTGAMQLHATALMRPDGMEAVARRIARSESPDEGSITAIFADALETYCSTGN